MRKAVSLKDVTDAGEVQAEVATLEVIDKDRDVTLPGFFGKQSTRIVGAHDWTQIMLGKGVIEEQGLKAVFTGRLNLEDSQAEQMHAKLRFDMSHPPPMIEWSYGFSIKKGGARLGDWKGEQVRFLQPLDSGEAGAVVHEVSPVLIGAGEGTRTLAVKGSDTTGLRFADELSLVVGQAEAAAKRAQAIAALRNSEGKELGEESMQLLSEMTQTLEKLTTVVADLSRGTTEEPEEPPAPETLGETFVLLQAQYEALTSSL